MTRNAVRPAIRAIRPITRLSTPSKLSLPLMITEPLTPARMGSRAELLDALAVGVGVPPSTG